MIEEYLLFLQQCPAIPQGMVGYSANKWATQVLGNNPACNDVPEQRFDRRQLLNFCDDRANSTVSVCACIFAWGGMNRDYGRDFFKKMSAWMSTVDKLRDGAFANRALAYKALSDLKKNGSMPGVGPAYFTKLLFFLSPKHNGYIMDQWTSKSVNLLTGNRTVDINTAGIVTMANTEHSYENFCRTIESLSELLGVTPMAAEEMIFSKGGRNKGLWRQFVINNWIRVRD